MAKQVWRKGRIVLAGMCGVVALSSLAIWGCGTSGYDDPASAVTTTRTESALIEPETLKQWMDEGKVNGTGPDKVVIIDASTPAQYAAGHIPGAVFLDKDNELVQTRLEGLAAAPGMVPDGSRIDSYLQRCGIDKNSTVVFTTNAANPVIWATRGYFTLRYWGFPKERIKVLNGYNKAWDATHPGTLTTAVPTVTASSFSVRDNGATRPDLRASLGEMIQTVKAASAGNVIIDTRGSDGQVGVGSKFSYDGDAKTTPGVFLPSTPADYVVFEGHMKGGKAVGYTSLLDAANNSKFLPADQLISKFAAVGMDAGKTAYLYCRTGVIASSEFFVLDGILGWTALDYDGSWSQWGSMGISPVNGGPQNLEANSLWRTDVAALSEVVTYNPDDDATDLVEKVLLDPLSVQLFSNTNDLSANQIEKEDAAYMAGGAAGGPAAGAPAAGTGGGGC
ncbi:MAG: hypothetical protein A2075_02275 [Geobacteraceae bacterium GWC2_58_44]|nr:MAG: hypothetical protein A2075_02275 [Geobacteraceae bacterium GWC2_58_44]